MGVFPMDRMRIDGFQGRLLVWGNEGFDEARALWNGIFDRSPACIAQCLGAEDVAAAVRYARESDLPVSVRGGGHGVAGTAVIDDGVVIDLSAMRSVHVDPRTGVTRVQGGTLLGDVDRVTQQFGFGVPAGIVSHTGVGGLTLGGGIGWLMRHHGLTIDNLTACEVVTADGNRLRASDEENPDLFWGLRGGGGNFGVVTEFEFQAQPVGPEVFAGSVYWAMEDAADVLRFYSSFIADAPDELTTIVFLRKAPPIPLIPEELHGRRVVYIGCCWSGDVQEGERALAPLRRFGRPLLDLMGPKAFPSWQQAIDPVVPHGWHYYWKSRNLAPMSEEMIDVIVDHAWKIRSPRSNALIFQLGGAVSRIDEDATAYSHRDAAHSININGVWLPEEAIALSEQETRWTRDMSDALDRFDAGVYVNFLMDEGSHRVEAAYGKTKFDRLVSLKDRYDPTNFFRSNQNIKPSALQRT